MSVDKSALDRLRIDRSRESEGDGRKPVAIGVAIVVVGILAALGFWLARPRPLEVTVAEAIAVQGGGSRSVLDASGYVTARRQATVSSKVTGRVDEVLVEEGMRVAAGQVLARLDPITSATALRLAEAQVEAAASNLEETRVRVLEAQLELSRAQNLVEQEVASQSELDRARAQVRALQARLLAQEGELEVAQRQLAVRRQDLEETIIRAPFAGVVISKNAQPGEMISPMSSGGFTRTGICTIVDMDSLEIEVDVNEAYINRVETGQRVIATLDAYPEWKIPAHVITVVPAADRQKATVRVRIAVDEKDPRILPDMGVKVSFVSDEPAMASTAAVSVPREAIRRDGERDVVFVVTDGRAERRAVTVGSAASGRSTIVSGLRPGERVVVEAPREPVDGDRIEIVEKEQS